jgi:hypothetical protein
MSSHLITATKNVLLLTCLTFCQLAYTQSKTVEVTDPRPVAKAIEQLEAIYGVPITYDDPVTVHESQLQDVTEQVQRTPNPSHRVIVQRESTLSFSYKPLFFGSSSGSGQQQTPNGIEAKVADALSSVLDGYANAGGPVTFTVTKEDGIFHVVPANFLNKDGKLQQMTPILDTKITILPKQRSRISLLQEICQALTEETGIQVDEGVGPYIMGQTTISGSDVTARSLLDQLFAELAKSVLHETTVHGPDGQMIPYKTVDKGSLLSWQLFYGPGFGYALNIHQVPPADK